MFSITHSRSYSWVSSHSLSTPAHRSCVLDWQRMLLHPHSSTHNNSGFDSLFWDNRVPRPTSPWPCTQHFTHTKHRITDSLQNPPPFEHQHLPFALQSTVSQFPTQCITPPTLYFTLVLYFIFKCPFLYIFVMKWTIWWLITLRE